MQVNLGIQQMNRLYRTISIITILVIVSPQHPSCSTLPNCLICSASEQCFKCSSGFLLQQKKCLASTQKKSTTEQNKAKNLKLRRYLMEGTQDSHQGKRLVRFGSQGNSEDKKCLFQWKGVCVLCGFKWEMGIGAECLPRFDECLNFSQFMCAECNPMFFHKDGQCIDLGCATDNYYHCNNCKTGFKMTKYGHCEVQNCKTYQNGRCKSCLPPFILISQICVLPIKNCQSQSMIGCQKCSPQFHPINSNTECKESSPLCLQYLSDGTCKQCKFPQLILMSDKCVDPNCITADDVYGYCLTCGVGYQVDKDKVCRLNFQDINCLRINVNVCLECKQGFFVGGEGKCQVLPENCIQQTCKYCKKGFISVNDKCIGFENCKKLSPNNFCLICNQGYALTTIGTCTKSIPVCLQYSVSGCSKCPPNYILDLTPNCKWNPSFKDPNCLANNYKNQCVLCRNRFRLSPKFNNLCLYINTQCKTSNSQGQCTSCYQGYQLNQYMGDCVQSIPILNCAAQSEGRCIRCSDRFFLVNAVTCKEVDMLCNQYDRDFGFCTTCYDGYVLNGKRCELPLAMTTNPTPALLTSSGSALQTKSTQNLVNCRTMDDKDSSRCVKCFESYYINKKDGNCLKIDTLCKTFDQNDGSCLSCYEGYRVVGTTCKMQNFRNDNQIITYTLNCRKPDHSKRECLECVDRFIKDGANCKQVSSLCNTFDRTTGACLTCYQGYILSKSSCISISSLTTNLQNCEKPSLTIPITCLICSTGYYWQNDHCQKVSILCATSNSKGQCITCIQGYFKNDENTCIMAALGYDPNCQKYDNNGYCIKCKSSSKLENFLCV